MTKATHDDLRRMEIDLIERIRTLRTDTNGEFDVARKAKVIKIPYPAGSGPNHGTMSIGAGPPGEWTSIECAVSMIIGFLKLEYIPEKPVSAYIQSGLDTVSADQPDPPAHETEDEFVMRYVKECGPSPAGFARKIYRQEEITRKLYEKIEELEQENGSLRRQI